MIIRLPIDTKSLYFNIKNDNQSGHTATVATPMKQGKSIHEELARILEVPENISEFNKEDLSTHILSKSRAEAKIVKTFVFERVTINGIKVDCDYSFCIYIREETGVDNALILQNLGKLLKTGNRIWVRIPVIGGVNDNPEEMQKIHAFFCANGFPEKVELLPYHTMGEHKYAALEKTATEFFVPEQEKLEALKKIIDL